MSAAAKHAPVPKVYVILVAPAVPRTYLAAESDEDDGEPLTAPPRSSDVVEALQFSAFTTARTALRQAELRWPGHEFRLDAVEGGAA